MKGQRDASYSRLSLKGDALPRLQQDRQHAARVDTATSGGTSLAEMAEEDCPGVAHSNKHLLSGSGSWGR